MLDFIADKVGIGMTRRDERGFTLIELLIVIIILGILAAIVIFAVGNLQSTSKQNSCKAEVRTVETAATAWITTGPLTAIPGATSTLRIAELETASQGGPYLKSTPQYVGNMTLDADGDVSANTCGTL